MILDTLYVFNKPFYYPPHSANNIVEAAEDADPLQ